MAALVGRMDLVNSLPNGGEVTIGTDVDIVTFAADDTSFVAWVAISWIDPFAEIRGRDFVAADIFLINRQGTFLNTNSIRVLPGVPGDPNKNLFQASIRDTGRALAFRLRSLPFAGQPRPTLAAGAEWVIITNP